MSTLVRDLPHFWHRTRARKLSGRMKPFVLDAAYVKPLVGLADYHVISTILPCHPWKNRRPTDPPNPTLVKPYCDAIQPMVDWVRTRTFKADDAYMFEDKSPALTTHPGLGPITVAHWCFSPTRANDAMLFKLTFGGS